MTDTPDTPETPIPESGEAKCPQCECDNAKPMITYDDFAKLDLRVGKVVEAGPHPNADRLLVLKVDLGGETRQIIAGIRASYQPEEILGREIVIVANLQPRKMRGLESQGMLIAAVAADESGEKTNVVVLTPEKEVPAGTSCS
ncbi:MAG: methionine--tRNA ligase subunit beta [Phycisphaerae bacterium]|nr:methionine--tRNA ligase subunit beta [Phycisphaerae bacterium]